MDIRVWDAKCQPPLSPWGLPLHMESVNCLDAKGKHQKAKISRVTARTAQKKKRKGKKKSPTPLSVLRVGEVRDQKYQSDWRRGLDVQDANVLH